MIPARFGALWLVAAALIFGTAMIGVGHVRWGGLVVAGAMSAAALFRLLLSPARAGGLVVRSRSADVIFLSAAAIALFVIVITVDLQPRV